jgi:hypothetical protein
MPSLAVDTRLSGHCSVISPQEGVNQQSDAEVQLMLGA